MLGLPTRGRRRDMPLTGNLTEHLNHPVMEASASDAAAMAELHAEALPPGWPLEAFQSFFCPNRHVLKIEQGPDLHGFGVLQQAAGEAEILTLAVRREMRRRGLGFSLISALIDLCRKEDLRRLYLDVAEGNIAARALYEKSGFAVIARREHYYQSGRIEPEAALIMKLDVIGTNRGVGR